MISKTSRKVGVQPLETVPWKLFTSKVMYLREIENTDLLHLCGL